MHAITAHSAMMKDSSLEEQSRSIGFKLWKTNIRTNNQLSNTSYMHVLKVKIYDSKQYFLHAYSQG